jgi:hypothetical protein
VGEEMGMCCTTLIVAWEDGLESNNTIGICGLDTSQEGTVPSSISYISSDINARVDTGGVAIPDIDVDIRDTETSGDVDVLDFEVEGDTGLAFGDILANVLAGNVVWTICDFGGENAGGVGSENGGVRVAGGVVVNTSLVVVDCFVDLEGCKVTAEFFSSWICLLV